MSLPETLTFEVTEEDIREGHPEEPTHCPVARAIKRALAEESPRYVLVDEGHVEIMANDGTDVYYEQTERMKTFIGLFDEGFNPSPFKETTHQVRT